MKIIFIRHGQTKGNEEKRYIGRTDESLSQKGIEEIKNRLYPDADTVWVSPMKRCVETAKIIYPDSKYKFAMIFVNVILVSLREKITMN